MVRRTILALIGVAALLWVFLGDTILSSLAKNIPSRPTIGAFLRQNGVLNFDIVMYDGGFAAVYVGENKGGASLDCLGRLPCVVEIHGYCHTFDATVLTNHRKFACLDIPFSVVSNETALIGLPLGNNAHFCTDHVWTEPELVSKLKQWTVTLKMTDYNIEDVCSVTNAADYYGLWIPEGLLDKLNCDQVERIRKTEFTDINLKRSDYFWECYGRRNMIEK